MTVWSQFEFNLIIVAIVLAYPVLVFWKTPQTRAGRVVRILCLINGASWVVALLLTYRDGRPDLITGPVLWLLNLPLLVAAIGSIRVAFKSSQEKTAFLIASAVYVGFNIFALCVVPAIGLLSVR